MERDPETNDPVFEKAVCRYEFHRGGAGCEPEPYALHLNPRPYT